MLFNIIDSIPQDMQLLIGWYVILGFITLGVFLNKRQG